MRPFRKKPVVIGAVQLTDAAFEAPHPNPEHIDGVVYDPVRRCAYINTPEGVMRADRGDWIIRGVIGEIYPCKADIFAATYEPVDTPHPDPQRVAIGLRDQQIAALRAQLQRARTLLEAWEDLDYEECEGPDGSAVMIDQHAFDAARDGLDEFLHPPREESAS